jgi:DNA-binding transcriptional LysR family regulator
VLSLAICAGVTWGNAILPPIVRAFMAAKPEISVRLEVVGGEQRMRGLAAGTYDLSYGVTMPRFENIPNLVFVPLIAARYLVYARIDHPLRAAIASGRLSEAKLHGFGWIKYY